MPDLNVTLVAPDGTTIESEIPGEFNAEEVINDMVSHLDLPWVDEHGKTIKYYLEWVNHGKTRIQNGSPLVSLGIKDGDMIALKADVVIPVLEADKVNPLIPPSDPPGQVTVNLNVLDVNKVDRATFNTGNTIGEILSQVISDYHLLTFNPKLNLRYTYKLGSKALARYLHFGETLAVADVPSGDTLTVYREEIAGAIDGGDARSARLQKEFSELMSLSKRGSRKGGLLHIEPVNYKDGCPVEEYIITFKCKGIIGTKDNKEPIYREFHQVKITLGAEFPLKEPYLRWLTPIWHPNIEHLEPHHVCTNYQETWWPGRALKDLVMMLGEMVQYKQYHAAWKPPYPLDREVANWVEEFAEPNGVVSKSKPVDKRHLLPPERVRAKRKNPPKRKVKFESGKGSASRAKTDSLVNESPSQLSKSKHVKFGVKAQRQKMG